MIEEHLLSSEIAVNDPITLASLRRKVTAGQDLSTEEQFWLIETVSELTSQVALEYSR